MYDFLPQPFCTHSSQQSCPTDKAEEDFGCMESCTGLYADVVHTPIDKLDPQLSSLMKNYLEYKHNYAKNIKFDSTTETIGTDAPGAPQAQQAPKEQMQNP